MTTIALHVLEQRKIQIRGLAQYSHDSAELLQLVRSHEGAKHPVAQRRSSHTTRGGTYLMIYSTALRNGADGRLDKFAKTFSIITGHEK